MLQNLEAEANKLREQLAAIKQGKSTERPNESMKRPISATDSVAVLSLPTDDSSTVTEDRVSINTESDDLSGRERDLYFAEQQKRARYFVSETDTDEC